MYTIMFNIGISTILIVYYFMKSFNLTDNMFVNKY